MPCEGSAGLITCLLFMASRCSFVSGPRVPLSPPMVPMGHSSVMPVHDASRSILTCMRGDRQNRSMLELSAHDPALHCHARQVKCCKRAS